MFFIYQAGNRLLIVIFSESELNYGEFLYLKIDAGFHYDRSTKVNE